MNLNLSKRTRTLHTHDQVDAVNEDLKHVGGRVVIVTVA